MTAPVPPSSDDAFDSLRARATQALQAGLPADALALLHEAAALRPNDAATVSDLGRACLETGDLARAIDTLRQAVSLDGKLVDAWLRLGLAYERAGDARSAMTCYDRATSVQPSFAEAWLRSGELAHAQGRLDDAIVRFRRAQQADPDSRFGWLGCARAFLTRNLDAEAELALQKAIAADPGNADAHELLGHLLSNWGRFDEAHACFSRAVELSPRLAGSYYELVRCRRVTRSEQALMPRIEALLASPAMSPVQRQRLHLAAGKVADDLDDPERAMRHFDAADALRPGSVSFDSAAFDQVIDGIIDRCTPELMAQAANGGNASSLPVFVVGLPRSGTTLLEQIISSHPSVSAAGELPFWTERGAAWHLDAASARDVHFLDSAASQYLQILHAIGPGATHVTDKMPFNVLWAGAIHLALPRALIVHCRRSPIDTALSIHQTMFHPHLSFPTGGASLVAYFRSYERLTRHWRRVLPASKYIEVDYESLAHDPEPSIRRIIDACGLPWSDACLTPHLKPGVVRTPSKWQARQPINANSVAKWRRYEPWLGALRDLLDSDPRAT